MGVKQDYLMRMINDVVRGLALVLTGQREVRYELPVEEERTEEESSMPGSWRWQTGERSMKRKIFFWEISPRIHRDTGSW